MTLPFDADCGMCATKASDALKRLGRWGDALQFRLYLCPACGDKRCARASNHEQPCSKE